MPWTASEGRASVSSNGVAADNGATFTPSPQERGGRRTAWARKVPATLGRIKCAPRRDLDQLCPAMSGAYTLSASPKKNRTSRSAFSSESDA